MNKSFLVILKNLKNELIVALAIVYLSMISKYDPGYGKWDLEMLVTFDISLELKYNKVRRVGIKYFVFTIIHEFTISLFVETFFITPQTMYLILIGNGNYSMN